jgi:hypothetical protein
MEYNLLLEGLVLKPENVKQPFVIYGMKCTSAFGLFEPEFSKGQIMSECILKIINFPKYHRKNLTDFCQERFYRLVTCDLF